MISASLVVQLHVRGPVLTRDSEPGLPGVDAPAARDDTGERFILPATHVKGRLLDAWRDFGDALSTGEHSIEPAVWLPDRERDPAETGRGRVEFDDFVLEGAAAHGIRHRIAIDEATGAVRKGALFVAECPVPSGSIGVFTGRVTFEARDEDEARRVARWVELGLRWTTSLGSQRSVGFGRVADVRCAFESVSLDPTTPVARAELVLRFDRALCITRRPVAGNLFESDAVIPGSVLRGALAMLLKRASGHEGPDVREIHGGPWSALAANFDDLRIDHAFPCAEGTEEVPVEPPLSLALGANAPDAGAPLAGVADVALVDGPFLLGSPPAAPAFRSDWKDGSGVRRAFGWPAIRRRLRVRTAIDPALRRAKDQQLFAYDTVVAHGLTWRTTVDLSDVVEHERAAVLEQFTALVRAGLHPVGKTKARADVQIRPERRVRRRFSSDVTPRDGCWVLTLQTPALMADARVFDERSDEDDLREAFESYFRRASDGALTVVRYFARQSLAGGPLVASALRAAGRPYAPLLLSDPGSVFVLRAPDRAGAARARDVVAQWAEANLPLPGWWLEEFGDHWTKCPFLPRDGFGAVAVNLRCHEELRPSPEQIHAA